MKTLNRFRKRNIQTNIAHFLLVIFIVAVSVCLITGLFISHLTFKSSVDKFYANSNLPNLWIEANTVTVEDESFFQKFDYGKRFSFKTRFSVSGQNYDAKILVSDGKISSPYLIEGDKGNGCFVDAKFASKHRIGINYSIVYFDYDYAGKTEKLSFKVLGSMSMAEDLVVDDECAIFIDEQAFINALKIAFPDAGEIDLSAINYNQILISSQLDENDKRDIETHYQNSSSNLISMMTKDEMVSFKTVEEEIEISRLMLWTFPLLFIVVAILVVVSAISDLVAKEKYNIGMLKSLGVSNREILSNYCGYGVFMCLCGALVGVLLSPLIVPNMTFETYDAILNLPHDEVKMMFPFSLVISTILISVLIGYFSSFFVCLNLILKTPKDCMFGVKKIKTKSRNKRKNYFGYLGSALKNMKINKTRTVMSVVGIAGCSLLGVIGLGLSLDDGLIKSNKFLSLETFCKVFQLFSIVILMLTILILAMQIFKERAREIAMLRINGKSYTQIWLSVIAEMLVVALLGFVLAAALSYPVLLIMLKLFSVGTGVYLSFWGFAKTCLIIMILIFIVSVFVFNKIVRMNLADSTKFSE